MTYDRLELLKLMYLSREGDRREGVLLRQAKGWFQVAGMGHEALAAIGLHMQPEDYLFPYYRDRAMVLAKGLTNADLASAYFGKIDSSSGGRQMPGHYSSRKHNIWSVPTPTGANCLPACGVAWGMQLNDDPHVAVATMGDAASRQGEIYEAISFAIERQLPIVFVVEDNNYGISTNTEKFNPFKLGVFNESYIVRIDARHPDRVFDTAGEALQKARSGNGPTVLLTELDRLCSHTSSDDHRGYRDPQEIEAMFQRDPIEVVSQELIDSGQLTEQQWQQIKSDINEQVDKEYLQAEQELDPTPSDLLDNIFGPTNPPVPPPIKGGRKWRIVDAVNETLRAGLESSRSMIMFGEDIESPKGGVFKLTADLSDQFPDRVFNSPLAEATIAGVGIGLACYGMRPVFEIQFIDFVGPAMNQICQNLTTLRWRTRGDWTCPTVFYAPYGAYLPAGALWHSQANESTFAHFPGLRVVVPSTPEDAAGLLWTAMHTDDPTLFLVPKHLLRVQMAVDEQISPVDFGSARIVRPGDEVTVVSWGNCMEQVQLAAAELEDEVSLEIIDLRCVQPWDKATVASSIAKTGRLVVVQEDGQSCSIGQMIISDLINDQETFYNFVSPPQLVSKPDVFIGYNPVYEYAALPDTKRIIEAVENTLED